MCRVTLIVTLVLALVSCGDDGVHHLPDAPPAHDVTLTIEPAAVVLAAGATTMVTATIVRNGGFTGEVVVTATTASGDLTIIGGTIAADATSIPLTVTAAGAAVSATLDVSVAGASTVIIEPAPLAVTIAGRIGPALGGEAGGDQAGTAIALSADGKRVVIGAKLNDATGVDAGHARVYERSGNTWAQVGADLDGEAADDRYGGAVAISNDGSRVAIGSYQNDGNGNGSGHVRVFELAGATWTQLGADLDGAGSSDGHGWTLALSASGSRIVVGAPTVNSENGTAHVYDYAAGAWTAVGAPIAGNHELGHDVDISDDGNRIAISAPSASGALLPGEVQVYAWSGTAWTPLGAAILGAQPSANAGDSIALSADGELLAIGSSTSDNAATNAGDVRVFRWNVASSTWIQVGAPLDGAPGTELGTSVAISADGMRVLAGGPSGGGSARLFTFSGGTWTHVATRDFGSGERTGAAVALSPDGRTAAVGAPYADAPGNLSGAVRLYDLP